MAKSFHKLDRGQATGCPEDSGAGLTARIGLALPGGIYLRYISSIERAVITKRGIAKLFRIPKIETLKRQHFPEEGKAERVAKALEALRSAVPLNMPLDVLKAIVENPDFDEQSL